MRGRTDVELNVGMKYPFPKFETNLGRTSGIIIRYDDTQRKLEPYLHSSVSAQAITRENEPVNAVSTGPTITASQSSRFASEIGARLRIDVGVALNDDNSVNNLFAVLEDISGEQPRKCISFLAPFRLEIEMAKIRTFLYPTSTDESTPPLTLSLSRRGPSILLVHPLPLSPDYPNERQHAIINALARDDPFPALSEDGRVRVWLKEGVQGKEEGEGGENLGLRIALLQAGIIIE